MGILDFLLGGKRGKRTDPSRNMDVAKGLELQSDEERSAARQRMEDEMDANRARRDSAPTKDA